MVFIYTLKSKTVLFLTLMVLFLTLTFFLTLNGFLVTRVIKITIRLETKTFVQSDRRRRHCVPAGLNIRSAAPTTRPQLVS